MCGHVLPLYCFAGRGELVVDVISMRAELLWKSVTSGCHLETGSPGGLCVAAGCE